MFIVWQNLLDNKYERVEDVKTWEEAINLLTPSRFITGGILMENPNPLPGTGYYFYAFMDDEQIEDNEGTLELFKKSGDEDWEKYLYTGTYFIVSKKYWEDEGCLDDSSLRLDLPNGFHESMESTYEYEGNLDEGIAKLKEAGFKWNQQMEKLT